MNHGHRASRCPKRRVSHAILLRVIQAIGLTSNPRKKLPPAVDDVSFDARAGHVTMLLGVPGVGKTTTLRLMLELQPGRGVTYFRGRPLHRISHPVREVGLLLGEVPGHPARTVCGHIRMLCAAAGVPVGRGDEVLESVGLVSLREKRLGTLSRGMDRRLGLACALLADPHTLVLDEPTLGLSADDSRWLHGMLRAHAAQGGTVLSTTADPREAARLADRVVTLEQGRLMADQPVEDFSRTRLRPRVAVRTPHATRLSVLLVKEARSVRRSVEVTEEGGNHLSVYGSTCAEVGETAFRHSIVVHRLADEIADMGSRAGVSPSAAKSVSPDRETSCPELSSSGRGPDAGHPDGSADFAPAGRRGGGGGARVPESGAAVRLPPPVPVRPVPRPLRPLRYEIRRATGVRTGFLVGAAVLVMSALTAVLLALSGHTSQPRLLAAWPGGLPLPPAALGAGLLGALAFGDEFRHPALLVDRGGARRRPGLLIAKLLVASASALVLAALTIGCDAVVLYLLRGREFVGIPADRLSLGVSWLALVVGCGWAGVLAAGVLRSTAAGFAAVLAVPLLVVPLTQRLMGGVSVGAAAGAPSRMREVPLFRWSFGGERYLEGVLRMLAQPVGGAMALSLTVLLCVYLLAFLRNRVG